MEKNVALIGIGNAGGQVSLLAEKNYPELFDCIYINSSDADLSMITTDTEYKYKIGDRDEIEGSGKNRAKMKQFLKSEINNILGDTKLQVCLSTKRYAFVIASAAGGTGSGAAPVLTELLSQMFPDTNFILVGILPQIGASLLEQGNALEFLTELYDGLGENTTYMIYDNESTADMPPTKALEAVNREIVEDIRILTGIDNFPSPYESIDQEDLASIITTPGRLLVTRVTSGLTEKAMEDSNLSDIIVKNIKRSCHAETDRNKRVIRWGVITYFTNEVNALYNPSLDGVVNFLGTPVERFNHNAINQQTERFNFLYLIASGLSPINDRVTKITDRIAELKAALAGDNTNKYILAGEGSEYSTAADRMKVDKKETAATQVDANAIFAKFM